MREITRIGIKSHEIQPGVGFGEILENEKFQRCEFEELPVFVGVGGGH
jgi:hypothetical protein